MFFSLWAILLILLFCHLSQAQTQNGGTEPCGNAFSVDCGSQSSSGTGLGGGGSTLPIVVQGSNSKATESGLGNQVYVDSAGSSGSARRSEQSQSNRPFPPEPLTDMQRLALNSTGEVLPIFGHDLFRGSPSTFAPADQIPALADYVVAPGDVLLVRLWGPESFNGQLTVDSSGSIYIPQVGAIHVAGLRADQLETQISADLRHTFRNFNLSVNLGHLRSIQVYVVGEARRPGAYTVSSLSTLLNVLFVSGGPNVRGSMRHIQVRRRGQVIAELDLYDILLRGDQSKDIRLEPDDTIFIPVVGSQVAFGGSVRHPAIYEIRADTTLDDLIELGGGFTPVASRSQISVERIEPNGTRAALAVALDAEGRAMNLRDGDVVFANHMTTAFQQSVTIRGNLANPGRFQWHPGMRLSEVIPDRMSLLTNNYWQVRNRLGMPVPLFEPLHAPAAPSRRGTLQSTQSSGVFSSFPGFEENGTVRAAEPRMATGEGSLGVAEESVLTDEMPAIQSKRGSDAAGDNVAKKSESLSSGTLADEQQSTVRTVESRGRRTAIAIPAPEIDWSYAVIERLDPETLRNSLVPFNLGKLVIDHDQTQNLELQPGDVVTILSQADVQGPQDERTKYVRLEGEFNAAGVYSVGPNETLDELIQRAGGLTSKAYLYGASFTRESARVFQQQRLDEYVSRLSVSMQRDAAVRTASAADPSAMAEAENMVGQLRNLKATGRIVLEFQPDTSGVAAIPHIPLEDGDVFRVPSRPLTVAVIGAVYGQNILLYDPQHRVADYVRLAGRPNPTADVKHAFIIRADGSIFSREQAHGAWKNDFDSARVYPGDSIMIPEKPIRPSAMREVMSYSQLFSQFALGAAAIAVIE